MFNFIVVVVVVVVILLPVFYFSACVYEVITCINSISITLKKFAMVSRRIGTITASGAARIL